VSTTLTNQTLLGAARLLTETGDGPEAPEGDGHVAGRHDRGRPRALEQAGMRAAFLDAVMAATERSKARVG